MRKIYWSVALVAVVGLALSLRALAAEATGAAVGDKAPDFTLQDQNGANVDLRDFNGKVVVLEWTNPHCPFVQRHYAAHTMIDLANEFKDQGVVWLAINSTAGTTNDSDKAWAAAEHIPYPVLNDVQTSTGKAYHATNTPEMFIINKDGVIVYEGAIDNDPQGDKSASDRVNYVKQALDELEAGKPISTPETKPYGCHVSYRD